MDNKELNGVLFEHKKLNEKHPDYKGSAKVGGVDYYVAAWKKVSKAGKDYLSLRLERADKYTKKDTVKEVAKAVGGKESFDNPTIYEEVPF